MRGTEPFIAIVDDDLSVCRALKRLVRSTGMEAEAFTSAEMYLRSVDAMPSFHADCLILDVQMPAPGMTGLELQAQLARRPGPMVPIIFITAQEDPATRQRAFAAGAIAFLIKPFSDELLARSIRAALNQPPPEGDRSRC